MDDARLTYFGENEPSLETARVLAHMSSLSAEMAATLSPGAVNLAALRATAARYPMAPAMPAGTFSVLPMECANVKGEWVFADGAAPDRRILLMHGGGYVMGSPEIYRPVAATVSQGSGCAVFSLRYRLAPEHPIPVQIEDALAGFQYILWNGPAGPAPARSMFAMGASAGGSLALSLCLALRDRKQRLPDAVVAIAPWSDVRLSNQGSSPGVSTAMAQLYLGRTSADDPLASPGLADLHGFPPILLHASTRDTLLDQNMRLFEAARDAGVDIRAEIWRHMPHVWHQMRPLLPEANDALARIGSYLCGQIDAGP
jgi:monoterpene epsilon-lactone hydrolase